MSAFRITSGIFHCQKSYVAEVSSVLVDFTFTQNVEFRKQRFWFSYICSAKCTKIEHISLSSDSVTSVRCRTSTVKIHLRV